MTHLLIGNTNIMISINLNNLLICKHSLKWILFHVLCQQIKSFKKTYLKINLHFISTTTLRYLSSCNIHIWAPFYEFKVIFPFFVREKKTICVEKTLQTFFVNFYIRNEIYFVIRSNMQNILTSCAIRKE